MSVEMDEAKYILIGDVDEYSAESFVFFKDLDEALEYIEVHAEHSGSNEEDFTLFEIKKINLKIDRTVKITLED